MLIEVLRSEGVFVFDEDTHTLRLKSELFDLRVGYANSGNASKCLHCLVL